MLVTLRSADGERFFLDITVKEDGSVAHTIGPLQGKELAERWERFTLIRHRTWEEILSFDIKHNFARRSMFDIALRRIVTETDAVTALGMFENHHVWMDNYQIEPLMIRNEGGMTANPRWSKEDRS